MATTSAPQPRQLNPQPHTELGPLRKPYLATKRPARHAEYTSLTEFATRRQYPRPPRKVVAAVNGQADVLMDGGVRRASDIVKALCLGARAVMLGRSYAYGLAAAGKPGVTRALDILRAGVERTFRLIGCPSVAELNPSSVTIPKHW